MRVLLDATAVPVDRRGVGRYVDSLVPALSRAGADVHVLCRRPDVAHYAALGARPPVPVGVVADRPPTRLVWEQVGLPRLVRRIRPDVLHSPHYTSPLLGRVARVVTLHDATFFTDRDLHTTIKGPFFRAATRVALRRADACVVPSEATADELVRAAQADRSRLHVAYHGVDGDVFHPATPAAVDEVRSAVGVPNNRGYVAFLGTLEPRKNVPALIRGFVEAFAGRPDPPALVLAGGAGWDSGIDAAVAAVPRGLTVVRPGYLPVGQLAPLLGGATVVAYPSLGEGFGLPVLEAMACGAAVLTTRRLALPEVGGDAVAYTDPDAASIGKALAALVDDPDERQRLGTAARARAAGFTWDACARAHIAAYEAAIRHFAEAPR